LAKFANFECVLMPVMEETKLHLIEIDLRLLKVAMFTRSQSVETQQQISDLVV